MFTRINKMALVAITFGMLACLFVPDRWGSEKPPTVIHKVESYTLCIYHSNKGHLYENVAYHVIIQHIPHTTVTIFYADESTEEVSIDHTIHWAITTMPGAACECLS